jgi:predicted metal-binding protein
MKTNFVIKPRKIPDKVSEESLQSDLERYRNMALEKGATETKIITTDQVIVDARVRAKCLITCGLAGANPFCPVKDISIEELQKIVNLYKYAIFVRLEQKSEDFAGPEVFKKRSHSPSQIELLKIVEAVEAAAFYDGYHLALSFGGGSCKSAWCQGSECSAMQPGGVCRHGGKIRPSMEGTGFDAMTMAANQIRCREKGKKQP